MSKNFMRLKAYYNLEKNAGNEEVARDHLYRFVNLGKITMDEYNMIVEDVNE